MQNTDLYQLVQIAYWLALSTWFGGVLFVAIAAPVIHRTVADARPTLTNVLAVNLDGQHSTLLSGSIVANLLQRLTVIELLCGGVLVVASILQAWLIDLSDANRTAAILRVLMLLAAIAVVVYRWRIIWPKINLYRAQYIEHADEPDIANPAREQFDREQRSSVTVMMILMALLLGMILFSVSITPKRRSTVPSTPIEQQSSAAMLDDSAC